eukprot:6032588-Alexandrium_andersonii.AAC.1
MGALAVLQQHATAFPELIRLDMEFVLDDALQLYHIARLRRVPPRACWQAHSHGSMPLSPSLFRLRSHLCRAGSRRSAAWAISVHVFAQPLDSNCSGTDVPARRLWDSPELSPR